MAGIIQKNSFWTTIVNYIGVPIGFVSAVVLFPRILSPEEVGLTNVLRSASILLAQVASLGGANIVLRFFPFFKTGERQYNGIFALTFLISLCGIVFCAALYLLFKPYIVDYYLSQSPLFAQYCLLVIPMSAFIVFYSLFSAWLRSLKRVIVSAVYIEIVLRCCALLSVLIYAAGVITFDTFIKLFVAGFAVPAIGLLIHCGRCGILTFRVKITEQIRTYFKPALKYGFFCLFASLGSALVLNIDTMMLGGHVGLEDVAVYGIAINFMSMLQMPYRAMLSISGPVVAEYWQGEEMAKMGRLYKTFSLNVVIITLALFLLVWVNIDTVYLIMPPLYSTGKWALLILFAGRFVDIATGINSVILNTSKRYHWDLYLTAFLVVSAVVTNLIFIPLFGIEGAALATTISVVLLNVIRVLLVKHFFRIQPFTRHIFIVLSIAIAAWLAISLIPVLPHWTIDLLVRCAMVALLFVLPVYLLKLSSHFNEMIDGIFKELSGRIRRKR